MDVLFIFLNEQRKHLEKKKDGIHAGALTFDTGGQRDMNEPLRESNRPPSWVQVSYVHHMCTSVHINIKHG